MENYGKALKSYEKALGIYVKIGANHHNVSFAYKNAAVIYVRQLNYEKALTYLKKGLTCDSTKTYEGLIYAEIVNCYIFLNENNKKKFDENINMYYNLALTSSLSEIDKAILYAAFAMILIDKKEYIEAEELLKISLSICKYKPGRWAYCVKNCEKNIPTHKKFHIK